MREIESMLQSWTEHGLSVNPPAPAEALAELEVLVGKHAAAELSRVYLHANGMQDSEMDERHFSFWSIDQVLRERDVIEFDGREWIAFADVLICSWFVRIAIASGSTPVWIEATGEKLESVDAFAERYVQDPDSLGL